MARIYQGHVKDGKNPQMAFINTINNYLLQKGKVPDIYSISNVQSIKITKPDIDTLNKKSSEEIFNGWRNSVAEEYRKGNIDLDTFQNDIKSLELMEDVVTFRNELKGETSGAPKHFEFNKCQLGVFT